MSVFMFGVGTGRLTKKEISRRSKIAKKHGAHFNVISGNSGHCVCGHGCRLDFCPIKKYWFSGPNYGAPFDNALARSVMEEINKNN